MKNKGFNLFDECAARCLHLPFKKEECTSFSLGDNKMYTTGSIASSQRMLTQFIIFKPLSYCFEETIRLDVKNSFANLQSRV